MSADDRWATSQPTNSPRLRTTVLGLLAVLALGALSTALSAAEPSWETLEVDFGNGPLQGTALRWSNDAVHLLARDGRIWEFEPNKARSLRKLPEQFSSYSAADLRAQLRRELGEQFEVTGTGHYLVAHPRGQRAYWASRFEELYRSFIRYFSVRGTVPQEPPFPMVAIVWPTQLDFVRYAAAEGTPVSATVLGYYSIYTNRIALFDQGGGQADSESWTENSSTIIHEATHQTAFNTGLHSRFVQTPRWLAEGLGTLFEAPGVWDSANHPQAGKRVNEGRLRDFQHLLAKAPPRQGFVAEMISSDRWFQSDPSVAYAHAWALTYFLVETRPKQYFAYLKTTASKAAFSNYPAAVRQADFMGAFGRDVRKLEADFLGHMRGIPKVK